MFKALRYLKKNRLRDIVLGGGGVLQFERTAELCKFTGALGIVQNPVSTK